MGGGFNDKPFELNAKCLIISGSLTAGYFYLPPKRTDIALGILFSSYILLSWYDAYDMCQYKLSANTLIHPLTASLKPPIDSKGNYGFEEQK